MSNLYLSTVHIVFYIVLFDLSIPDHCTLTYFTYIIPIILPSRKSVKLDKTPVRQCLVEACTILAILYPTYVWV